MGLSKKKPEETPPPDLPEVSDEQLKLHRYRYKSARRAGMSWFDAKQFADSTVDIEEMRALARKGCSPELLLQILL